MSKHKKMYIQSNQLLPIKPVGETQKKVFDGYEKNKNLFLTGSAGTGKTFILLHLNCFRLNTLKSWDEHFYQL